MTKQTNTDARPVCYRCMKPAVTCVCNGLRRVKNRTGIYIVQHVRERAHALGTARFATLGLERFALETVFASGGRFRSKQVFPPGTALLYPRSDALPLEKLPPNKKPLQVVLIDGTWPQASRIYRDSPNLQALPCVTFAEIKPSNYRIRLEPNAAANATIEAVCRALQIVEPDTPGVGGLLEGFDAMIDAQLKYIESENPGRRVKIKTFKQKDVPRRLQDENASLVIACGDRVPRDATVKRGVLWTWNALRLCDGLCFSETIAPDPSLNTPGSGQGLTRDDFRAAWRQFIKPEDVLVTWDNKPIGRLFDVVGPHPHFLFLKAAYGNLHRGMAKTLDELVKTEQLFLPAERYPGFAPEVGDHLGKLRAVIVFMKTKV